MNIWLLAGVQPALFPSAILCERLPIKGIIGLESNEANRRINEYQDFGEFARLRGSSYIPMESYSMKSMRDQERLLSEDISLLLIMGWQRLIPQWLIQHCKIGVVGAHGSPEGITRGRGRSPQNWSLLLGLDTFSLSIFWADAGIDSGAVIDTAIFRYSAADDIFSSHLKASAVIAEMILRNYQNGNLLSQNGEKQLESDVYYMPQRIERDGAIDWSRSAADIYNFIRGLTRPYPGAFTILDGKKLKIWRSQYISFDGELPILSAPAGSVLFAYPTGELLIKCGSDCLLINEWEAEGGEPDIKAGMRLESVCWQDQIREIVERHQSKLGVPVSSMVLQQLSNT